MRGKAVGQRGDALDAVVALQLGTIHPQRAVARNGDLPGGGVGRADDGLHRHRAHRGQVEAAAKALLDVAHAHPPVVVGVEQGDHARRADRDGLQALGVQQKKALAELAATREAVHQKALAAQAVLGRYLIDHGQQHLVVADAMEQNALVVGQVARHANAGGEKRRQHDAVIAVGKVGKAVAVLAGGAARAVHDHCQVIALVLALAVVLGHVEAVAEALVELAGKKGGGAKVVIAELDAVALAGGRG